MLSLNEKAWPAATVNFALLVMAGGPSDREGVCCARLAEGVGHRHLYMVDAFRTYRRDAR